MVKINYKINNNSQKLYFERIENAINHIKQQSDVGIKSTLETGGAITIESVEDFE